MSDTEHPQVTDKPRKRKKTMSARKNAKIQRLTAVEEGPDCRCNRFRCFDNVTSQERETLRITLKSCASKDEQDALLSTCITVQLIQRRRPRQVEDQASFRDSSYSYKVHVCRNQDVTFVDVCYRAFMAIFGITNRRGQTIKAALHKTGRPPQDKRGKHKNHPAKDNAKDLIRAHISSLRARKSHYSLSKTKRVYLSDELNIKKLFAMFMKANPTVKVSYELYRTIFNSEFNIAFGYPRSDTCSACDEFIANIKKVEFDINNTKYAKKLEELTEEKRKLEVENTVHKRKAEVFYERKRAAGKHAKDNKRCVAFAMDYQKNLSVPNKSTNDVYYRRQLTCVSFNIHVLANKDAYFYCYDETTAKKGSDDVSSLLYNFFINKLNNDVKEIEIFCDSCGGQNKNYTVIRFLHWTVHGIRRFERVKVTFPIRGHSYLECDKNMGLINQKADAELPNQWWDVFRSARKSPSPFVVVECEQNMFFDFSSFLQAHYKVKCPFPTRPIRELIIEREHPQYISIRNSFNGVFETSVIVRNKSVPKSSGKLGPLYDGRIAIKKAKYDDLQVLKRFCGEDAKQFFDQLPHSCCKRVESVDTDSD